MTQVIVEIVCVFLHPSLLREKMDALLSVIAVAASGPILAIGFRFRVALLLLAAVASGKQLSAQASGITPQVRRIAGCYTTMLGNWSGPPTGMSDYPTPPQTFQLDTFPVGRLSSGPFAVRPDRLAQRARKKMAEWAPRGDDSIRVVWSTGFVGVVLQLAVHQDRLVGRAKTFHDAHFDGEPPDPTATVIALRRTCQSPRDHQRRE